MTAQGTSIEAMANERPTVIRSITSATAMPREISMTTVISVKATVNHTAWRKTSLPSTDR